jgi:hypothetical protein
VPERRPDQPLPWLGLLIWALACFGLFVSLLMQSTDLNREPRFAARDAVSVQIPIGPRVFDLPRELDHAGPLATELSLPR